MAYTKTNWVPRTGTNLNKYTKSNETAASVVLVNTPDSVAQPGTPYSAENMNHIEQGIYDAHELAGEAHELAGEIQAAVGEAAASIEAKAPIDNPTFTGTVTVPLPALDEEGPVAVSAEWVLKYRQFEKTEKGFDRLGL